VNGENPRILAGRTFTVPAARPQRVVAVLLEHLDPARPARILDLGCGTGVKALALAREFPRASVTGVDLSPASIAVAEAARVDHRAGGRVTFSVADYLAFAGGPFEAIVAETVLYAIPAPDDVLFDKLARDLVPGGLLVYTMPTDAPSNRVLAAVRRGLRLVRGDVADAAMLAVARALHGRRYDDVLLRERVPYMYVVPDRYDSAALHAALHARWGLEVLATEPVPRASPAQLVHRLVVARRAVRRG
jgi:trans-aconitate methyltransferase